MKFRVGRCIEKGPDREGLTIAEELGWTQRAMKGHRESQGGL